MCSKRLYLLLEQPGWRDFEVWLQFIPPGCCRRLRSGPFGPTLSPPNWDNDFFMELFAQGHCHVQTTGKGQTQTVDTVLKSHHCNWLKYHNTDFLLLGRRDREQESECAVDVVLMLWDTLVGKKQSECSWCHPPLLSSDQATAKQETPLPAADIFSWWQVCGRFLRCSVNESDLPHTSCEGVCHVGGNGTK